MPVEVRGHSQVSSLTTLHWLVDLELTNHLDWLDSEPLGSPCFCLLMLQLQATRNLWHGCWDSDLGLHACTVCASLTKPDSFSVPTLPSPPKCWDSSLSQHYFYEGWGLSPGLQASNSTTSPAFFRQSCFEAKPCLRLETLLPQTVECGIICVYLHVCS